MTSTPVSTHGHYLLLLSVAGVSQEQFDATAAEVNAAYMEQFGAAGALTAGVTAWAAFTYQSWASCRPSMVQTPLETVARRKASSPANFAASMRPAA